MLLQLMILITLLHLIFSCRPFRTKDLIIFKFLVNVPKCHYPQNLLYFFHCKFKGLHHISIILGLHNVIAMEYWILQHLHFITLVFLCLVSLSFLINLSKQVVVLCYLFFLVELHKYLEYNFIMFLQFYFTFEVI